MQRLSVVAESDPVPNTAAPTEGELPGWGVLQRPRGAGSAEGQRQLGLIPQPALLAPCHRLAWPLLGQVTDQQTAETPRGEPPGNCRNEDGCLQKQAAPFPPRLFMQHQPPAVGVRAPLLLARLLFWSRTQERTNLKVPTSSSLSASSFVWREKEEKPQRAVQTGEMLSAAAPLPVLCAGEYGLTRYQEKNIYPSKQANGCGRSMRINAFFLRMIALNNYFLHFGGPVLESPQGSVGTDTISSLDGSLIVSTWRCPVVA